MALREGDALGYLRLKQSLQESDSNAVIAASGGYELLPVLFRTVNGKQELYVDVDDQLINPRTLPGFVRLERMPEEVAFEQANTPTPQKPTGSNWTESRLIAETEARQLLASQQAARRESNGVGLAPNSKWASFAEEARRVRNSKKQ
jgi:hypothetical protein